MSLLFIAIIGAVVIGGALGLVAACEAIDDTLGLSADALRVAILGGRKGWGPQYLGWVSLPTATESQRDEQ